MKQEISDGHGAMNDIYKLYVYKESNKKRKKEREESVGSFTSAPMDGGVGKCGQNAGDVMERDLQKLTTTINRKREIWSRSREMTGWTEENTQVGSFP
jgi:hypothetical protein